jgi:acyl carrier protein
MEPTIDSLISLLEEIAPRQDQPITSASHLVDDLDFDAMAFSRLGVLIYERYGIGGLSSAAMSPESLTVEGFFQRCVVDVLGLADNGGGGRRSA